MSRAKITKNEDLELTSILDQTVSTAIQLDMSESEIVSRLLERFQFQSEKCRSAVHIDHANSELKKSAR